MMGSSMHCRALEASLKNGSPEDCLVCIRKTLAAVDSTEIRATHRLAAALRLAIDHVEAKSKNDSVVLQICSSFAARVRVLDPRRVTHGKNLDEVIQAYATKGQPGRADKDEWDAPPPLSLSEQMRLIDVQRPFQSHVKGQFILKPGVDGQAMMTDALDGRALTVEVLLKLHRHLEKSFSAGGCVLSDGALMAEVQRILKLQHSLPAVDRTQTACTGMMDELSARN
jgi:hypothetical protein